LLVQKVTKKDTTPKNSQILLSHKANHTNCHAKFGVHTGRGQPTARLRNDNLVSIRLTIENKKGRIMRPFGLIGN
jgi:hypothetical protein